MDDGLPLIEAHAIATEVEEAIKAASPGADIVIHQDPVGISPEEEEPAAS